LIAGKEDAAGNFARGYYEIGPEVIDYVMDRIRLTAENCDGLQGFIAYHSFTGGTGSGLGALMFEHMHTDYAKKTRLEFAVYPSRKQANGITDPINCLMAMDKIGEHSDVAFMVDNEQMYNLAERKLGIQAPMYNHLNQMIAQAISMATSSLRFEGELNCNLPEFQTNLVPFPRCHYPVCSYAPYVTAEKAFHDSNDVKEITSALFEPGNILVDCERGTCLADCPGKCEKGHQQDDDHVIKNGVRIQLNHKFMACCLIYRGDVLPAEANRALTTLKARKTIQFVDWIGDGGFKMGINKSKPTVPLNSLLAKTNRAAMLISNTSKLSNVIQKICYKFKLLDKHRAFTHWYVGAGMEESDFADAITNLEALQMDYEECCLTNEDYYGGE